MWFVIGLRKVQGKARPARCKFFKPKLMSLEAQDSPTTRTTRRILIFLFIVILVQANIDPKGLMLFFCRILTSFISLICKTRDSNLESLNKLIIINQKSTELTTWSIPAAVHVKRIWFSLFKRIFYQQSCYTPSSTL